MVYFNQIFTLYFVQVDHRQISARLGRKRAAEKKRGLSPSLDARVIERIGLHVGFVIHPLGNLGHHSIHHLKALHQGQLLSFTVA